MVLRKHQPTKIQTFQKHCSGYAFACLILFGFLQLKSVQNGLGETLFIIVNRFILLFGMVTFLASAMVGVNTLFKNRSKFKGTAIRVVDAIFADEEESQPPKLQ